MENKNMNKMKGAPIAAILSFLISAGLCSFLISETIINKKKFEKIKLERQTDDISRQINEISTWHSEPDDIALIFAGLSISLMIFFVMYKNYKLKNMQSVFEAMAITDSLTGIFNRRYFMETVQISIEKAHRQNEDCYIMMFDIDKFKNINDTYGHQIGDKVLMDITARIKTHIRPYDLFARYGGEEFIIFVSNITKEEIFKMGERLRGSLCNKSYIYDNINLDCSASFGIAKMEDYNLDKAIRNSDEALYEAKRKGRNCVVCYSENVQPK